ncbi:MAG: DUF6544 family protein [Candidatus Nanopelagicales bacterium]
MRGWIAAGVAAGAGAFALRKGLQRMPDALPPFGGGTTEFDHVSIPPGLPAPVARYLDVVAGPHLPDTRTAVFGGRLTMRMKGVQLPGRWRFSQVVGQGYRHYFEITAFGQRVMTGEEWYLDGHAKLDLPFGVTEGEPNVDRAANIGMWGEYLWLPSALVDPRARWEAVADQTARMVVPQADGPDALTGYFDAKTGLLDRFEAIRWRDAADPEPIRWVNRVHAWTRVQGIGVPAVVSVQWADQPRPWLRLSLDEIVWNADLTDYIRARGA